MNFLNKILDFIKNLNKLTKILLICFIILIILILTPTIWYNSSLKAVSKTSNKKDIVIEIGSGSSVIADVLDEAKLIKNKLAFKLYVKLNSVSGFQAGEYTLDQNMDIPEIVSMLKTGTIMKEQIGITFVEGKSIRHYAKTIAEKTNNTEQDVFDLLKDEEYINEVINKYSFITEDIKNKDIYYPLEGYLFPDTYLFDGKDVSVKTIFNTMLDKMEQVLNDYSNTQTDLSIHEILSLASIVEQEGTNNASRKGIASVFFNRLDNNMSLGSDVTTYYAYGVDMGDRDLTTEELYTYNPYNTRGPNMFGKLPVGPICSPSKSSIEAVISPDNTGYMYFVADKNGDVYFAKTLSEHQSIISNLKNKGLWFEY